jgi:galactose-1-phosphate uridylyltransferase
VSLFDDRHFVEIGTASAARYADSFINCADYLGRVLAHDPDAVFQAITQNHLPSAGGSLVHPHLQVQADRYPSNHHRFLRKRAAAYHDATGRSIFSDYLDHERREGTRCIGRTGAWEWVAAYAPEGFYEIWAILPAVFSIRRVGEGGWADLARGVLNTQRFYRHLCRNGYNLGLLTVETADSRLALCLRIVVRSNYTAWARNDHSGFEVMLGDMATFTAPEETAKMARPFWEGD